MTQDSANSGILYFSKLKDLLTYWATVNFSRKIDEP